MQTFDRVKCGTVIILFLALAGRRMFQYSEYQNKLLWSLETLIFLVLAVAFTIRTSPRVRASNSVEIILPYVASPLPFALTAVGHLAPDHLNLASVLMIVGNIMTIVAIVNLGRSFGLSVEVRQPVSSGLYAWIRHPVYAGEIITTAGLAWSHWCLASGLILLTFVTLQCMRALMEERKLSAASEDYAAYQHRTGMFWPRVG